MMNTDFRNLEQKGINISDFKRKGKLALGAVIMGTFILTARNCSKNNNKIYLVDLNDEYDNEAVLLDENGKELEIKTNDSSQLVALVTKETTRDGKKYKTVIINENGEMITGYMDGKYLEDEAIDTVEVKNDDILDETSIVSAKSGLWLREDDKKELNHDTENATLLKSGSYVATSSIPETSKDNSYEWKEAISYEDKELKHGYIVSDYVIPTDYDSIKGKRFNVNLGTGATPLKLRSDANTNSEIIYNMNNGEEVVLIPNVSSYSDGTYDWFYVAVNTQEGVRTGYVAATWYNADDVHHYLIESPTNENYSSTNNDSAKKSPIIMKIVDTSKAHNIDLKLRKEPSLDGEIVSNIENGTTVYTTKDSIEEPTKKDNIEWLKVSLINGTTGYVASQYLTDIEKDYQLDNNSESSTINFDAEGSKQGYFGIDVQNTISASAFENLVSNSYDYNSVGYSVSKDLTGMTEAKFVIFKLGATYTSRSSEQAILASENYSYLSNLQSMVAVCEEKQIPYGFYYYSQATDENDINIEANFIKNALTNLSTGDYFVLPVAIDVEDQIYVNGNNVDTRVALSASINGKSYQTNILNKLMNRVRDENDVEVISYLSRSSYSRLINQDELDKINQKNPWIVDPSSPHSADFAMNYQNVSENASIRQIALDGNVKGGFFIDVNFIDKNYFEKILKKHDLISKQNQNGDSVVLAKRK
ncbi:MAG: SH3 domain-containing protein [bacterium]|nr:SH3 domain-containing protein [bacterium]